MLFTASVYAVILAGVVLARHHPPQDTVLVICSAVCVVFAAAYIVVFTRMAQLRFFVWVRFFGLLLIGASGLISGWWGESNYTQYAIYIALACIPVSMIVLRREMQTPKNSASEQR